MWQNLSEVPPLRVLVTESTDRLLLRCAGEIDLANIAAFVESLTASQAAVRGDLELDLRDVTFFDSCALQALEALNAVLALEGRRLTVHPKPRGVRLFRLAGIGYLLAAVAADSPDTAAPAPSGNEHPTE